MTPTLPPFSWSRQHIRFQKRLTAPAERIATVGLRLPQWGRWWIATFLWGWRSEQIDRHRIRLCGTSLLLGRARLELTWTETTPASLNGTLIFDPSGPIGVLYWIALWPLHQLIFPLLLSHINQKAQKSQ